MKRDLAAEKSEMVCQSYYRNPTLLLGTGSLGSPRWIGVYAGNWEIVVYEREAFWEACFFDGHDRHEHLKAASIEGAQHEAERRIDSLQMACPRSACDGVQTDVSQVTAGSVRPNRKSITKKGVSVAVARPHDSLT
jgi:hypothetical protein